MLQTPLDEFEKLLFASREHADGWVGLYWGKTTAERRQGKTINDAIVLSWPEWIETNGKKMAGESDPGRENALIPGDTKSATISVDFEPIPILALSAVHSR